MRGDDLAADDAACRVPGQCASAEVPHGARPAATRGADVQIARVWPVRHVGMDVADNTEPTGCGGLVDGCPRGPADGPVVLRVPSDVRDWLERPVRKQNGDVLIEHAAEGRNKRRCEGGAR